MEFFLSPPSKDHQRFRLYCKFANVIHSIITGKPDDVNPFNFVDIFKSNHKSFDANECTYIFDIVVLSYVLSYCIVILLCCCIVILSCCHINMMMHGVLSFCFLVVL
jgi:hypothetical protein